MKTGMGLLLAVLLCAPAVAVAEARTPSFVEQAAMCQGFVDRNFSGLLDWSRKLGYELADIYDQVVCDSDTDADLIKHRASLPTARSDIMSLARYFIKVRGESPERVAGIFNRVVDNPFKPRGTLLDWVDYYRDNPSLSDNDREEMKDYEEVIRRFGGKRESELVP